jgi:hypothetical protein
MPKTVDELKLHLEIVKNIYNYCLKLTYEGKKYNKVFKKSEDLKIEYEVALTGLKNMCKEINVDYSKLVKCKKQEYLWKRYFGYDVKQYELLK